MYKTVVNYIMSGTGNSYRAAVWATEEAGRNGIVAKNISIDRANPKSEIGNGPENLIGIFCPTHGFTAPWGMIVFALRMPRVKGAHAFISASRAGWLIGPWYLPGLEGTTGLLLALILLFKGYDVRGVTGLDMPSNWLVVHWGLNKEHVDGFVNKSEQKIKSIFGDVLNGKRKYVGWVFVLLGILLIPVSLGYLLAGRLMLSKVMFADNRCNSCGLCADNCPFKAILMKGGKNPRPYWTFRCESCERCIAYCPQKAIQGAYLYLTVLFWIMFSLKPQLITAVSADFLVHLGAAKGLAVFLVAIAYNIVFVWVAYPVLFAMSRIPVLNKIFYYTTLTAIFRRYHEPRTKLKDLR
jgi:ferredoxin